MKNITIQFASLISTFLPYEKSKNITSFLKKSYFKSPLSPRAFNHGPGPGSGLSPSTKLGPRALQKTRAPGRARAGLEPWPITTGVSNYNFYFVHSSYGGGNSQLDGRIWNSMRRWWVKYNFSCQHIAPRLILKFHGVVECNMHYVWNYIFCTYLDNKIFRALITF